MESGEQLISNMGESIGVSPVKYMLSGSFAGLCAVGIEHPLEIGMRTLPQSVPVTLWNVPELFKHLYKGFRNESVKNLYKGAGTRFSTAGTSTAITFFGYGLGRRIIQSKPTDDLSFPGYFFAGAFAGFLKAVAIPLKNDKEIWNLLKISVQKFDIQGAFQVVKRNGLKNFYEVSRYAFYRDIAITGLFFMTYDGLRGLMVPETRRSDICIFRTMIAGGMAGITFSAANIFADRISSQIATSPGLKSVDSMSNLIKGNGFLALYTGSAPVMIRSFSASAACFLGFKICLCTLNWIAPDPI